ncbi:MAG: hypothetical protein AAF152_11520 [Cyanobacteria bacterium P01_A01_bin.114]
MDAKSQSQPLNRFLPVVGRKWQQQDTQQQYTVNRSSSYESTTSKRNQSGGWWAERSNGTGSSPSVNQALAVDTLLEKLRSGKLWVVNSRRRNGIIIYREFHAEFAGPGSAVGGEFDVDCQKIIPLGNLSLIEPESPEDQQKALKIRLQWIRLTQNFTDQPRAADRSQMILEQFKTYFDQPTVDKVSDEAFASLVGVLPQTIRKIR